jgi:hypothetical protein
MNEESEIALGILEKYIDAKLSTGLPTYNGNPVRLDVLKQVMKTKILKEYFHLFRDIKDTGKC